MGLSVPVEAPPTVSHIKQGNKNEMIIQEIIKALKIKQ